MPVWIDPWTARTSVKNRGRASVDRIEQIKNVEIDVFQPYFYNQQKPSLDSISIASPIDRSTIITPSPSKAKPMQVRSASPRYYNQREEKNYPMISTPRLSSRAAGAAQPSYMAATESAKARIRSQSAPRNRPSTPEREKAGPAKKRLFFQPPDSNNVCDRVDHKLMMSPRCSEKSIYGGHFGMEQGSNIFSACTDSNDDDDEISPPSLSDFRRWFR